MNVSIHLYCLVSLFEHGDIYALCKVPKTHVFFFRYSVCTTVVDLARGYDGCHFPPGR